MSCLIFTVNLKVLGLTEDLPESLRIIVKSLRTKKRQYQDIRSRIKSSLK